QRALERSRRLGIAARFTRVASLLQKRRARGGLRRRTFRFLRRRVPARGPRRLPGLRRRIAERHRRATGGRRANERERAEQSQLHAVSLIAIGFSATRGFSSLPGYSCCRMLPPSAAARIPASRPA